MSVAVQREDFDVAAELAALRGSDARIGGVALFVGLVRDFVEENGAEVPISGMTLEHYPEMAERELAAIEAEANERWDLLGSRIVHRYGALAPGDQIVLVIAAATHRGPAFAACEFLMDWLKTRAPFWKLEATSEGGKWVDARESDAAAAARWKRDDE
jgi:molybdopterin synthase catalytic subunit